MFSVFSTFGSVCGLFDAASTFGKRSHCLCTVQNTSVFIQEMFSYKSSFVPLRQIPLTLKGVSMSRGICLGGLCLGGLCPWAPKICHILTVSVHGGGSLYDVTSCLTAWFHVPYGGVSVSGTMFLLGGGLCPRGSLSGGCLHPGGVSVHRYLSRGSLSGGSLSMGLHGQNDTYPKILPCPKLRLCVVKSNKSNMTKSNNLKSNKRTCVKCQCVGMMIATWLCR